MISALSNVNKGTTRKRVLDAANIDKILLSNTYILGIGDYWEFSFNLDDYASNNHIVGEEGTGTGRLRVRASDFTLISVTNIFVSSGAVFTNSGDVTVKITRLSDTDVRFESGAVTSDVTCPSGSVFETNIIGGRGSSSTLMSGSFYYADFNGELFSLNEGNGATVTGSNGTTGTINTSHSGGLNYINHEVIKPI